MPSLLDLRQRAEYALLRLLIWLIRLMPIDTSAALSAKLWRWLAPFGRKRHQRALANLALAYPEKSPEERLKIALSMWENLGRVMAETMQFDRLLADPSRIDVINAPVLDRYVGKFGSAVGVSLHTGNWELSIYPLVRFGANPAAVYRLVKNPYVDKFLRAQRKELYPGGLLAKGRDELGSNAAGQKTARQMLDYVRRGGRLGIVGDLYDKQGIPVPFFGHLAPSTPIPAMIARRLGSRVWLSRCIRIGTSSRFQIEVKELRVPRSANQGEDMKEMLRAMHAQFEAWVREYPEQWMWSNRRWS